MEEKDQVKRAVGWRLSRILINDVIAAFVEADQIRPLSPSKKNHGGNSQSFRLVVGLYLMEMAASMH